MFPPLSCTKCPIRVICCRAILHTAASGNLQDSNILAHFACRAVCHCRCHSALHICSTLPDHDKADLPAQPMVIYMQNRLLSTSKNATCYWLSGRFEAHFRRCFGKLLVSRAALTRCRRMLSIYWSVSSTISCTSRQCSSPVRRTHAACSLLGRHHLTAQQPLWRGELLSGNAGPMQSACVSAWKQHQTCCKSSSMTSSMVMMPSGLPSGTPGKLVFCGATLGAACSECSLSYCTLCIQPERHCQDTELGRALTLSTAVARHTVFGLDAGGLKGSVSANI